MTEQEFLALEPCEQDALVGEKVMVLDVRGSALCYEDEMGCTNIEHPDHPRRGVPEELMAVYRPKDREDYTDPAVFHTPWGSDDKYCEAFPGDEPEWHKKDWLELQEQFRREVAAWGTYHVSLEPVEAYTQRIAPAWQVVEKMRSEATENHAFGCVACVEIHSMDCAADMPDEPDGKFWAVIWGEEGVADTAPLAICIAALKAKGEIEDV